MPINVRFDGDIVVLSNIGRLMNDPRHVDASQDVRALLDQGYRRFVLELRNVREIGSAGLGLLTTLTRLIRQHDGDAVLASLSPALEHYIEEMRMDAYWESFPSVAEARAFFLREGD